jgi:hypothetical protein
VSTFDKIKKQNGETFAKTIRNYHNGMLEIPNLDVMLRHAGREAEPLIPYLMSLMAVNDDVPAAGNPFDLLKQAGYNAFHADTPEKQNSIQPYFQEGELLCTFNDASRCQNYHIVHAIKENADKIKREDFNGQEDRQDEYGTSVISIQMLKNGGFISIKNRYNHAVQNCDNTFNSNPDNIVDGLSAALKGHFNVDFSANKTALPEGYAVFDRQIFKYHRESNNIYYGDQAWVENGTVCTVNKSDGDALFDDVFFDNKTKMLKKITRAGSQDSFANDFNECYGGNRGLQVKDGNLTLQGDVLIGAEQSRIKTICLPALTTMGDMCLYNADALTVFKAPALTTMGDNCLHNAEALTVFEKPKLTAMGDYCLQNAGKLTDFNAPELTTMGSMCLYKVEALTDFNAPALTTMADSCLFKASALTDCYTPTLTVMGDSCLANAHALTDFKAPALTTMEDECFFNALKLTDFKAPQLTTMGHNCFNEALALTVFETPMLKYVPSFILERLSPKTVSGSPYAAPTLG